MRKFILISLAVLLLASCGCHKNAVTVGTITEYRDSTIYKETVRFDTLYFPGAIATINVPVGDLKNGFSEVVRKGHATASVNVKNNDLIVVANCDSLSRIIALKDIEIQRFKEKDSLATVAIPCEKTNSKFAIFCIWYACCLTAIMSIFIYFKITT